MSPTIFVPLLLLAALPAGAFFFSRAEPASPQLAPSMDKHMSGRDHSGADNQVDDRQLFKAKIRAQVLEKLGLKRAPRVVANVSDIPDILLEPELGDFQGDRPPVFEEKRSPIRHMTTFAEEAPACQAPRRGRSTCIQLSLSDHLYADMVGAATLYVYKRPGGGRRRLELFELGSKKDANIGREQTPIIEDGWVKMDIQPTVQRWLLHTAGKSRHLEVRCSGCDSSPIELTGNKRPFLTIRPPTPESRRYKRHAVPCYAGYSGCCLEHASFTFQELGLDFVAQPASVAPNRCRGSCDVRVAADNVGRAASHYADIMQGRMEPPCCAPDHLDSLSVLYYNDDGFMVKQDMPDFIALSCGCH